MVEWFLEKQEKQQTKRIANRVEAIAVFGLRVF